MTSKVSFLKLMFETLRRHTAAVLITVLGFFIHIITFFMSVQNIISSEYITAEYSVKEVLSSSIVNKEQPEQLAFIIRELQELCSPKFVYGVFALGFGAYLAFDFFRYMHSKRETDFYESMPIRRQTWFKVLFTSCFLLFFVLSAITTAIETAIVFSTGYGSLALLQTILWNYICMLCAFLVAWFTTALAMIMTGHSIIAFLGVGVFASYIPLILVNLAPTYCARFFDTYVYKKVNPNIYYFSPVTVVYKMTNSWYEWDIKEHWNYIIGCFVFALLLGIFSYLLFLRRPSETAGRAMAFEKANNIIRFMIVVPLALYAGLFLEEMATMTSMAWLVFGIIFGAFLLHGIIECIFQFDIKALLTKKMQLLATIIVCIAFAFVFWMDVFKYDEYIPNADDVKMVKLDSDLFGWMNSEWNVERDWIQGELVADAISIAQEIRDSASPSEDENYYMDHISFTYVMKDGREIKRKYSYDASRVSEKINQFYANDEVKDDFCVLYHTDSEDIQALSVSDGVTDTELWLSEAEMTEFIKMYLEEYSKLTLKEVLSEKMIFEINVAFQVDSLNYPASEWYGVYPSFTNTIAFIKEKGIKTFHESDDITITNMEIYGTKYEDKNMYVSDFKQLQKLKQYLILDSFINYALSDEYIYGEIQITTEKGISYSGFYIKQSDLDKVLDN